MRGSWLGACIFVAVMVAAGFAAWRTVRASVDDTCAVCRRPVHEHSGATGIVGGRRAVFCCPTCALSQHHQDGRPVTVTALTDYATSTRLEPAKAWIVRGSDVNPCTRQRALIDADKRAAPMEFDRCSPGLLAFAHRDDALGFASRHGGTVLRFTQLAASFTR